MARTTIPWGDGNGDSIYLDYNAASGNQTVTVISDANGGASSRSKVITFATTSGSPAVTQTLTVVQAAQSTDLIIITRNDVSISHGETALGYKPALPYDALIEYLQSTGTQYIDTGEHFLFGDEFFFDFMRTENTTGQENKGYGAGVDLDHNICSGGRMAYWASYRIQAYCLNTEFIYAPTIYGGNLIDTRFTEHFTIDSNGIHFVLENKQTGDSYTISNKPSLLDSSYDSGNNVYLFRDNSEQYAMPSKTRLYGAWLKRLNGTFAFDFIPVRVGQVGYLYDRVSGELFGNNGSGQFTLGPDV